MAMKSVRKGFSAIRNPIFRQMLRMQSIPWEDFGYNARGMDIYHNFPHASLHPVPDGR